MERDVANIIARLRKVKDERGLTIKDIKEMLDNYSAENKTGDTISESTLNRLFGRNPEADSFDYKRTIKPLSRVLLGFIDDEAFNQSQASVYYEQCRALRSIVRYRTEEVERSAAYISEMQREHGEQLERMRKTIDEQRAEILKLYEMCRTAQEQALSALSTDNQFYRQIIDSLIKNSKADN